jgi:putative lipoprotein (rSAM/lipoprotein system)
MNLFIHCLYGKEKNSLMTQITKNILVFILALIGITDTVVAQYGAPEHYYIVNGIVVDEITREPIKNIQLNDNTNNYMRQHLSDTNGRFQLYYNVGYHNNPLNLNIQAMDIDGNNNGGKYLSEDFQLNTKAKDFTDEEGRGWSYETSYKDTIIIELNKEKKKKPKVKKIKPVQKDSLYTQEIKAVDTVATDSSQAEKELPNPLPNNNNQSLVLYPNPTKNHLNLKYECTEEGILIKEIRILSTEGKLMLKEDVMQSLSYFTCEYNIGSWANGMYFIQFITENAILTEQFIKN